MQTPGPGSRSPGKRFGRYLLLDVLDRGGMADVYRAVMHGPGGFQRQFVVKRIRKEKAASREFVDMFVNEARISAMLDHPNIVQIYDFGQTDGDYFLSMEYLRGKNLLTVMRKVSQSGLDVAPALAAYVAQQVARGLHYAHGLMAGRKALGIVHRDVTPSNIFLLRAGGVKLLDFGIARAEMKLRSITPTGGLLKGKFAYMSPEQVRGDRLDGRSDIFSLGIVLWECLTGRRLFSDPNDLQMMKNVLNQRIPAPSDIRPEVGTVLDAIVMRSLARTREARYQTAGEMAEHLDEYVRETRFSPEQVVRLLSDMFGEDNSAHDEVLPEDTAVDDLPLEVDIDGHTTAALRPEAGAAELPGPQRDDGGYATVSSVRRAVEMRGGRARRKVVAAVAVAMAAAVVTVLAVGSRISDRVAGVDNARPTVAGAGAAAAPPARPLGAWVETIVVDAALNAPKGTPAGGTQAAAAPGEIEAIEITSAVRPGARGASPRRSGKEPVRQASVTGVRADADTALVRGIEALRRGEHKRALLELEVAVERAPGNGRAVGALAEVEFELSMLERALMHARRAARLLPGVPSYRRLEGDLAMKLGLFREAADAYRVAHRLSPRDATLAADLKRAEAKTNKR